MPAILHTTKIISGLTSVNYERTGAINLIDDLNIVERESFALSYGVLVSGVVGDDCLFGPVFGERRRSVMHHAAQIVRHVERLRIFVCSVWGCLFYY